MAKTSRFLSAIGPRHAYMMSPTCSCAREEGDWGIGVWEGKAWHLAPGRGQKRSQARQNWRLNWGGDGVSLGPSARKALDSRVGGQAGG